MSKTIKVRIPCVVDAEGGWNAFGCDSMSPDECLGLALEAQFENVGEKIYWINATLEVPEDSDIEGEVK